MRCLVIGGSGQDGILIAAQLLAEGHVVVSASRRPSPLDAVTHRTVDVRDSRSMHDLIADIRPDQLYFLAAHHRSSEDSPPSLSDDLTNALAVNATAFAECLDAVKRHAPAARTVYASSCRVFGRSDGSLLTETSPRRPACAYGVSKTAGMGIAELFRQDHAMFVSSAILFNHESELRGPTFLSRKLVAAALSARSDPAFRVLVDSLDDMVDWGSARDYAAAMRAIAQADTAEDFIVASGRLRTVREFAETCFAAVGVDWSRHVQCVSTGTRPRWQLAGNTARLESKTGWRARWSFNDMVYDLVKRTERHGRQRPADFHSYL